MANRAHLLVTRTPPTWDAEMGEWPPDSLVAAGANWILPVLWCSVFSEADISTVRFMDGDEEVSWPVLVTSLPSATQRAVERKLLFLRVFPAALAPIYDEWLGMFTFLERLGGQYLQLDTNDVNGLYDPHEFDALLTACVRAFADDRSEDWATLLSQAHIPFDPGPPLTACVPAGTDAPYIDMPYLTAVGMLQSPGQGAVQDDIPLALHGYSLMSDLNWTEFLSQRGADDHEG